jgi:uncharacterized protein YcnI
MNLHNPTLRRSLLGGVAALGASAALLLSASVGFAHVTVVPNTAPADTSTTLAIRVPTEREVPTVRLRVEFPTGLTVSRFTPIPGWTRTVERNDQQQITSVTWSGGQIGPSEFQDFVISARTPKEPGKIAFKAFQTYEGGETVAWENPEGSQERPSPLLTVAAPGAAAAAVAAAKPAADDHSAGGTSATAAQPTAAPATAAPSTTQTASSGSGSDLALLLGLGGLVLGAIALVLSIAAFNRRPRPTA